MNRADYVENKVNPLTLTVRMLAAEIRNCDMAAAVGSAEKTVAQWKSGTHPVPFRKAKALAEALGCTLTALTLPSRVVATHPRSDK